jgi:hypothetical protein
MLHDIAIYGGVLVLVLGLIALVWEFVILRREGRDDEPL